MQVTWYDLTSLNPRHRSKACAVCVLPMQRLQEEAQWLTVVEYVRALMQKRLVCRSAEERGQLAQQMVQDDARFREVLHGLVRGSRLFFSLQTGR